MSGGLPRSSRKSGSPPSVRAAPRPQCNERTPNTERAAASKKSGATEGVRSGTQRAAAVLVGADGRPMASEGDDEHPAGPGVIFVVMKDRSTWRAQARQAGSAAGCGGVVKSCFKTWKRKMRLPAVGSAAVTHRATLLPLFLYQRSTCYVDGTFPSAVQQQQCCRGF